jgi:hypothetical protein
MKKLSYAVGTLIFFIVLVSARYIPLPFPTAYAQVSPASFWFGAWPSYIPTTTNLTSVTTDIGYGVQNGKTAFFTFYVSGTSNGSVPQISVPYAMFNAQQTFHCTWNNNVAWTSAIGIYQSATTVVISAYNATAPANGTVYIFSCQGVYQTP